ARFDHELAVGEDLLATERRPVDHGLDQLAHQIVLGVAAALLDQTVEVGVQLAARAPDRLAGGLAGAPILRIVLADHLVRPAEEQVQSSPGTPRIHATTAMGSGAAIRSTKSHSPTAPPVAARSRISTAMRSMSGTCTRCARGVKRRLATRRSGPCRGGSSVTTISDGIATASAGPRMIPCALEKRSGCDAISATSACFVIAQNGRYPGGAKCATGASARSRVQTSCG